MSGCQFIRCYRFIRLNDKFVFPDLESPIINVLHGRSGICGQSSMSSYQHLLIKTLMKLFFINLRLVLISVVEVVTQLLEFVFQIKSKT